MQTPSCKRMEKLKDVIKKNFKHFSYFYSHLRYRIFVSVSLSFLVGILDGFGLTMFFPLLEKAGGEKTQTADGLGGLSFIIEGIEALGINMDIYSVLITIIVFFALKGVMKFLEQYYTVITRQYFIKKLRHDNVNKFTAYKYEAFVQSDSGRIQNTLSGEVEKVSQAYKNYFMAIQSGVLIFVYILFAFLTNPQFALLVVAGGALSNYLYKQVYKKTKETSKKITRSGHKFQGLLIQGVAYFKYLKATNLIQRYGEKLRHTIDEIVKSETKIGFYNSLLAAAREPIVIIVIAIVIILQIRFFSDGIGAIILSLLFFYRSLSYLVMMQNYWNQFLNVSGSLENMKAFMGELSEHKEECGKLQFDVLRSSIRMHDIQFRYNETIILKNINIDIPKKKTIAFVGESGSGKTTIVNLIAGLITASKGVLTIDEISSRDLDMRSYREKIGYITQEPVIFSDTIYNNVTFWAEKTQENLNRFWRSLQTASIDKFVNKLVDKEESYLGTSGILISGGQKQRLSIARELFRSEIELFIMDEATSALDSETENMIQKNINALKGKYTFLIVAHRLSTVKSADQIIVLKNGEITASGSFSELLETSSLFKQMVAYQDFNHS